MSDNNQESRFGTTLNSQLEASAKGFMNSFYDIGNPEADETKAIINAEVKFVTDIAQLTNAGAYDIYDSGIIQDGLRKCIEDLNSYCKVLNDKIDDLSNKIDSLNREEQRFDDNNRDRAKERNEKEAELRNTSIFNRSKRQDLKNDIANLQPITPYKDYDGQRKDLNNQIDSLKEKYKPLNNKVREAVNTEMKLQMKQNKGNSQDITKDLAKNIHRGKGR